MDRSKFTRIFLIRHGDTIDEESKKVYKGSIDIPLSEKGIVRIRRVSQFLSRFKIDYIYTSTLSRSIDTGRIIAEQQGLPIEATSAFNEIHFGVWEGLSFDEIRVKYPKELELWLKDIETYPPPDGEQIRDAQSRAVRKFYEIIDKHKEQTIGIVSHSGILRLIISSILDLRMSMLFKISQDYGCIDMIDVYEDNIVVIKLLNFTLYPELAVAGN